MYSAQALRSILIKNRETKTKSKKKAGGGGRLLCPIPGSATVEFKFFGWIFLFFSFFVWGILLTAGIDCICAMEGGVTDLCSNYIGYSISNSNALFFIKSDHCHSPSIELKTFS